SCLPFSCLPFSCLPFSCLPIQTGKWKTGKWVHSAVSFGVHPPVDLFARDVKDPFDFGRPARVAVAFETAQAAKRFLVADFGQRLQGFRPQIGFGLFALASRRLDPVEIAERDLLELLFPALLVEIAEGEDGAAFKPVIGAVVSQDSLDK